MRVCRDCQIDLSSLSPDCSMSHIGPLEPRIVEQLLAAAFEHDAAVLQHIGAITELEAMEHALLDEKDGGAAAMDLAHDLEAFLHHDGGEAERELVAEDER